MSLYTVIEDVNGFCHLETDDLGKVELFLWGRIVPNYVIYVGECPYRFFTGDLSLVILTLAIWSPDTFSRDALPSHNVDGNFELWSVIGSCECKTCDDRIAETVM